MAKVHRLEKFYERLGADGQPTKDRDGVPSGKFAFGFKETGNRLEASVFDIPGLTHEAWDNLPAVVKYLVMHGIMQKCGDPAAGETGDDVEESVSALVEMVLAGNFYAERAKGEARPSLIAEAVWAYKKEQGQVTTDSDGKEKALRKDGSAETLADIIARYSGKDGAAARAQAMKNKRVALIVAEVREAAAIDRAKKARERAAQAAEADTGEPADL